MEEIRKTAPNTSVGADVGQPSNNTTISISENSINVKDKNCLKWLSDDKKIDEPLFCEYFCKDRELRCFNGKFYSIDGEIAADLIQSEIAETLKANGITSGIAKKTSALFDALKLFCRSVPDVPCEDEIHVLNGVLKADGTFSHKKKFCKNRLNIEYSEDIWKWAEAPSYFNQFLNDLLEPEDTLTLQEYIGYCLIPSTRAQAALFIIGNGGEGKSRLGVALKEIFGTAMLSGSFQRVEEDKFFRYNLRDKLIMLDDDMQMTALKTTGVVKNIITAEIPIDIEAKGKQSEQARLYCRFICLGNGSPKALYDKSDGFARRLLILSTKPKLPDRVDDPQFGEKLRAEKNKVFCWAFRGLQRLIANKYKFTVSERTRANVREAISENCNIMEFIEEAAGFREHSYISSTMLHRVYSEWCDFNGLTALKRETFINWLKSNAAKYSINYSNNIYEDGKRVRGFEGIFIRT